MSDRYISERTLIRLMGKYYLGCCTSCHDDMDAGYANGIELDLGKGRWSEVCCKLGVGFDNFKRRNAVMYKEKLDQIGELNERDY